LPASCSSEVLKILRNTSKIREIHTGDPAEAVVYGFGPFQLDLGARLLTREGVTVPLTPKVFDTVVVLVENSGRMVSKEELMEAVWPGTFVEEMNLTQNISVLRRALGDSAQDPRYIITVSGRGYRFAQHVSRLLQGEVLAEPSASPLQLEIAPLRGGPRALARLAPRLAVLIVVLAALVLVGVSRKGVEGPYSYDISSLRDFRLTKLTDTGQITAAAVAPDGGYIAYVVSDGDRSSLWIGQTATKGRAQVLEPRAARLANVAFSPDGNYLYFTLADNSAFSDLYRVPTLGGPARLLVHDVDTPVTFSPDQKRIAFMRGAPQRGEFYLVRADADGGSEKVIATQRRPVEFEFAGPAWSPDGKLIAAVIQDYTTERRWAIHIISAEDGSAREIFQSRQMIGRLRWAPDGKGLLTVISETPASHGALGGAQQQGGQIWRISYPIGEARRLTNDLANYDPCCLDITAEGKTFTAVQNTIVANIWVAPAQAPDQVTRITSGPPVVRKQAWLPDSTTILYRDIKGNLYRVDRHGENPTLLTPTGHTVVSEALRDDSIIGGPSKPVLDTSAVRGAGRLRHASAAAAVGATVWLFKKVTPSK
jgi:DNA-binding winged helix-turn-helix (wHTH) protein/Tol biopolymer transport system component